MISVLTVLLAPYLLLVPGYSLLPRGYPRRLRLPFTVFASVAVTSAVGLALMLCGCFSVPLLAAIEAPLLLLRIRSRHWPGLALSAHLPVLLILSAVVLFAVLTAGEPFDATGDAGVYTISALHLSETGHWTWPLDEVIPEDIPTDLVVYRPSYVRPWPEVAPGFIVRGRRVVPQFFPLYPMWGAVFSAWLGNRGVLAANVLGAFMLLLGCDALFRLLVGRIFRLAGLLAVLFNPIFLVFLKYPSAEAFLSGLLAGWLLWMVLFLRRPTVRTAWMPAGLLALAILTKFFAWAVAGAAGIVLILLPWRRIGAAAVFLAVALPAVAVDVWLAAPHLENHLGQLMLLSGFKLVLIGCGLVLLLRLGWSRLARVVPLDLGVLYPVALIFLWGAAGPSHVRDYASLSGPLVLWGGAAGLLWYLWRRRAPWLVFPAFVFVLLNLYLFLGSGDSPYYPFAARRFLPITVPLGALFLVFLARQLARVLRGLLKMARSAAVASACLLLAAAIVPPLWTQRSAVMIPQGEGFLETLSALERAIPNGRPVLAIGQAWRYGPHLLLRGRPVFCLDLRPHGVLARVSGFLDSRPDTLTLSAERRTEGVLATVAEVRKSIRVATTPPLVAEKPRRADFTLFAVDRGKAGPAAVLDVGTNDELLVAGCFPGERTTDRSFRWTGESARLLVGSGAQVRFTWSRGGNPHNPLAVAVFARGRHLGDATLSTGWQTSRWFDLPTGPGPMVVEIRTSTFQPALQGSSEDRRSLGLRLDLAETR